MTTAPPRRGSPAPASAPEAGSRAHRLGAAEEEVEVAEPASSQPSAASASASIAGLRVDDPVLPVHARRLDRLGQASRPRSMTPRITWRIAERMRFEPAEPSASSTSPSRADHRRRHHRRQPPPRRVGEEAERREVLLAHHVVEVDAGAGHEHARALAVRARHRARAALGVEHRDVRRRAEVASPGTRRGSRARRGPRGTPACARLRAPPSPRRAAPGRRRRARARAARARRRSGCRPPTAAGW